MQNLKELLETLLKNQVDFVLVGGFASVLHGSTMVTQDLDICAAITDKEIKKLREALKNLNPHFRMNPNIQKSFLDHPKDYSNLKNIYLKTDLGIVGPVQKVSDARRKERGIHNKVSERRSNNADDIFSTGPLDIMSELPPVGNFEIIKKNAVEINLYGYSCKVISLEDLIQIKKTMNRPKDKETLRILLELQKLNN